jgi:hypothetical protein
MVLVMVRVAVGRHITQISVTYACQEDSTNPLAPTARQAPVKHWLRLQYSSTCPPCPEAAKSLQQIGMKLNTEVYKCDDDRKQARAENGLRFALW